MLYYPGCRGETGRKAAGQTGQIDVTESTKVGLRVQLRCSKSDGDVLVFSAVQQDGA